MPCSLTKTKCILILLLLFFWQSYSFSALVPVTFNTVSSIQGLPQNTARVLLQDRNGFVWVGTEDGLVRFNGYSMKSFRKQHDNPASLSDNYISALAESRDGRIWVGTMGGGLNVINPESGEVIRLEKQSSSDIFSIVQGIKDHELWLGTDSGLFHLDIMDNGTQNNRNKPEPNQFIFSKIPLPMNDGTPMKKSISAIVLVGDEIWFSTRGSGIGQYKSADGSVSWYLPGKYGLKDDTFNTIAVDHNGILWAGGQNHGLVQIIRGTGETQFKHYDKDNSEFAANDVMAIADAGNNKLWIGTWNGGLALFDPATGKAELYRQQPADPHSLASDIIMDILCTRDNQVWVGTFDRGICWFNPAPPFQTYRAKPDNSRKSRI